MERCDVVSFMPTPFDETGSIDVGTIRRQAAVYAGSTVDVGVLGGIGEYFALSAEESAAVYRAAVEGVDGGARVHAGVGYSTREAVRLAKAAADAGCCGIVANPLYYVVPSPRGLADHVRAISEESGLGVVIYSSALLRVDDYYLDELVKVEGFHGVKEEVSGVAEFAQTVKRWAPRVSFWTVGESTAPDFLSAGATTVTSSLANLWPESIAEHVREPERSPEGLQAAIVAVDGLFGRERGTYAAVAKEMIAVLRPEWSGAVRTPSSPVSADLRDDIREAVVSISKMVM